MSQNDVLWALTMGNQARLPLEENIYTQLASTVIFSLPLIPEGK